MEQRIKRDSALINLVSEFEASFEKGTVSYLSEKTFFQLISYYEDNHEYDKALDVAKLALDQFNYRSDFYVSTARLLLKVNAVDECLDYLQKASAIAPFENEITILKARALSTSGAYEKAFNELESLKPLALKNDMVEIYLCQASIYFEMGYFEEMYKSAKKAIFSDIKNAEAHEKFWVATELSKKYIETTEFLNKLIDENPYSYLTWFNLGHAYSFAGEYENAIEAMEYSFIIKEDFEDGYMDCADLCCQVKDFEKALKIYEEAQEIFGEDIDLLLNIAECQMYLNQTKKSKVNLYKAIKLDQYNDEVFYFLGECFSKEEKWYSAINAYHKAIEIEDNCEEYYLSLARAYVAVEDYNKATVNFNNAVSNGPELTHFWREFASFLIKLGLHEEALKVLDEAEEYTFGADLLYCRAISNFSLGNKTNGLVILEEALLEDYSLHTMLYKLAPELEVNKEISSMILYFAGE